MVHGVNYINSSRPFFMGCIAMLIENRYISANWDQNRPSENFVCFAVRWNVPVGLLCLHGILPGASLYCEVALGRAVVSCLEAFGFLLNVFKRAGFRSEGCGIGRLYKSEDFPTMNATAMTLWAIPSAGIGSLLRPIPAPPQSKQACFYPAEMLWGVHPT